MNSIKQLRDYSEWLDAEVPESEEEIMELEEEKMRVQAEIEAANERDAEYTYKIPEILNRIEIERSRELEVDD